MPDARSDYTAHCRPCHPEESAILIGGRRRISAVRREHPLAGQRNYRDSSATKELWPQNERGYGALLRPFVIPLR